MIWSRLPPERPPSTTATMCRSSVLALVIRLKPEARVKPVLIPSTPSTRPRSLLWLRWRRAGIVEHAGLEVAVVAREAVLDRAGQDGEVAGGRDLLGIGQAGGVAVDGARSCRARAPCGSSSRRTASSEPPRFSATTTATSLADFVTSALMASSTAMVAPGRRPSLEGAWREALRRDREGRVEGDPAALELLEQQVEGHHLGDRGRMAQRVLVLRMQDAAGLGVDHHGGVGRVVAAAARRACGGPPRRGRRARPGPSRRRPRTRPATTALRRLAPTQPNIICNRPRKPGPRQAGAGCPDGRCRRTTQSDARRCGYGAVNGSGRGRAVIVQCTISLDIFCAVHILVPSATSGQASDRGSARALRSSHDSAVRPIPEVRPGEHGRRAQELRRRFQGRPGDRHRDGRLSPASPSSRAPRPSRSSSARRASTRRSRSRPTT